MTLVAFRSILVLALIGVLASGLTAVLRFAGELCVARESWTAVFSQSLSMMDSRTQSIGVLKQPPP